MPAFLDEKSTYSPGTGELVLEVVIGEGQFGTYNVMLDDQDLTNQSPLTVGDAEACKGKTLVVVAVIRDTQWRTDRTSLTLKLSDNDNEQQYRYTQMVPENGGTVIYTIEIELK